MSVSLAEVSHPPPHVGGYTRATSRSGSRRIRHVVTLNGDKALIAYAKPIVAELRANMVRVDSDFSATPFKAKIADAEQRRVHTMLVIGGRDMEAGAVSVRLHHGGPQGAKPKAEVVADILAAIKERKA